MLRECADITSFSGSTTPTPLKQGTTINPHGEEARKAVSNHEGGWRLTTLEILEQLPDRIISGISDIQRLQAELLLRL